MKYGVTGSTGSLGRKVIEHLISRGVAPGSIIALARSHEKAAALSTRGIEVRIADYDHPESLDPALVGVDRLLLVSGSDPGGRTAQHRAVIEAAVRQHVKFIAYTSITRADTSEHILAPEHRATEKLIRDSGIPFALLRNNWYTENYLQDVQNAKTSGMIIAAAGEGKVASALRTEYAEAAAAVLTGEGHEGAVYELCGPLWSFVDLAAAASEVVGRKVTYQPVSFDERKAALAAAHLPNAVVDFIVGLDRGTAEGMLEIRSDDLKKLIGREPLALRAGIVAMLKAE